MFIEGIFSFLAQLEANKLRYRMNKNRDSIMVEISFHTQRWEVEFFADGTILLEKFNSQKIVYGEVALEKWLQKVISDEIISEMEFAKWLKSIAGKP
jgi:hypothetical protein